jgi:glycosyltransferase involved in cell wall biosynthesis
VTRRRRVALIGLLAAGHAGVPRYTAALVRALDAVAGEFHELDLRLVATPAALEALGPLHLDVSVVGRPLGNPSAGPRRLLAEQLAARSAHADLLHFFDLSGPVFAPRRRFVTTLHDASGTVGRHRLRFGYKRFVQPWAVRHAAAIVSVSAFSRDEAVLRFDADPQRITVVHSGPGFEPDGDAGRGEGDFLLYVGDLSRHKNLPFLVDVVERAAGVRLVLAGRPGDGYSDLARRMATSPAQVSVVANPSDEELEQLYRSAVATVLPSLYEGFGFTPLEAMARDCPVLASDIPAVREISGDGALLLPLDDGAAWVDAVRDVTHNERTRAELRARGRATVGRYSWQRTARGLCDVFRSVP